MSNLDVKTDRGCLPYILFTLLAVIVAVWLFVPVPFSDEITVYRLDYNTVDRKLFLTLPTTYKAISSQQVVLHWTDGVTPPSKLVDCAVRDAKNWTGSYPDKSGQLTMTKGKLSLYTAPGSAVKEMQLSKFQYYYIKMMGFMVKDELSKWILSGYHVIYDPNRE